VVVGAFGEHRSSRQRNCLFRLPKGGATAKPVRPPSNNDMRVHCPPPELERLLQFENDRTAVRVKPNRMTDLGPTSKIPRENFERGHTSAAASTIDNVDRAGRCEAPSRRHAKRIDSKIRIEEGIE